MKPLVLVLIGGLCLATLPSCRKPTEAPPRAAFVPLGLEVSGLLENTPVELYKASGKPVLLYPPLASSNVLLIFPWRPGAEYLLKAGGTALHLRAPERRPLAEVEVFAPLGSPGRRFYLYPGRPPEKPRHFVLPSRESCPEVGFLVTSYRPKLFVSLKEPSGREILRRKLSGEFDRVLLRRRLCLPEKTPRRFVLSAGNARLELAFERRELDLRGKVRLVSWRLPTEESGLSLRYRREGLLAVPNPLFERLGYALGIKARGFSRYEPFAFETLVLENLSGVPLNLIVRADFLDPESRKPVPGFYPPRFGMSGHVRKPLALIYLPPHGKARAVLPIYVKEVPPGEYLARVTVYPLGEEIPVLREARRFGVSRGKPWLAAGLLVILLCGGLYSVAVLGLLKPLLSGFGLRALALVSLAGAVAFGLDFLGGLLSNVLYALLGPFNILVGGLITEVVHYAVFTAVLVLVPRPGFATLSGLLHYLMGTVLFGGLRATDPFFVGFRLLTLEAFLLLFRAYRRPSGGRTVLALGLADALNTLASLILHMTFYRLFFPVWYLWLSILVKGFLYTLFGAFLGARVGRHLRGMER